MRSSSVNALQWLCLAGGLALSLGARDAAAEAGKASTGTAPMSFGNRTENSDGSVALTVGRKLATAWETKFGTDVHLAGPDSNVPSENLRRGAAPGQSSGALWGSIAMPVLRPLGWDKTVIEARLDAAKDEGKLGATLSRSLGENLSVTLQNAYSVTRPAASAPWHAGTANSPAVLSAAPPAAVLDTNAEAVWAASQTVRLNLLPSGTAISVGATSSTADDRWHNKLSVEQTLFGPLKVTTSVEDAGTASSNKRIVAGFKKTW
jgi:hypothetical protein